VKGGRDKKKLRAYITTMGCSKNLVDSEAAAAVISRAGCELTVDPSQADVLLVGACSFLASSWRDTVEEVERLAGYKSPGGGGPKLVLMGCLPVHHGTDFDKALPGVDHFVPTGAHERLAGLVESWSGGAHVPPSPRLIDGAGSDRFSSFEERVPLTPAHTAYVKVAEGCNRNCSFCAIPTIRGRQAVRPVDAVVREVERMVGRGVREVTLLSQDIVSYKDGGANFVDVVEGIVKTGIDWVRLFYLHPAGMTLDHVRRLFSHEAVVRYLEMPIQHASNLMLKRMRRSHDRGHLERLIGGIRSEFPDVVIRSEVIAGFPGETDGEFEELLGFVEEMEFDSLGVFPYSREPGTEAAELEGGVPEPVIRQRVEELAAAQEAVSFGVQAARVGKSFDVLVDRERGPDEESAGSVAGRFYGQALDIDGEVFVESCEVAVGEFVRVRITDSGVFDLTGVPESGASRGQ
jgi:ribosomal protein S12 methylthiotransferase